jgi:hypothetical protein
VEETDVVSPDELDVDDVDDVAIHAVVSEGCCVLLAIVTVVT